MNNLSVILIEIVDADHFVYMSISTMLIPHLIAYIEHSMEFIIEVRIKLKPSNY